jgi:hypothetical protein
MQSNHQATTRRSLLDLSAPAHTYAAAAGVFLLALGILSLIIEQPGFGSVGNVDNQPDFIIWATSGWLCILWIVMGALGLLAAVRSDTARDYALGAGVLFAVMAIWGFIDGDSSFGIFAAGTVDNITHAVLAALGLLAALMPSAAAVERDDAAVASRTGGRFSRTHTTASRPEHPTVGQR